MRPVTVRTADLKNIIINLGFVGENEHRQIRFDAKKDFEEYPNASASLTVVPPEGESYPAIIERDGDFVLWTITDSDVIGEGDGEIQLAFTEGEVVKRTCIARTKTDRSLVPTGSIPSGLDDFIVRAGALLEQVEETFPAGGTTGQVLAKKSDEDYDTEWVPQGTAEDLIDDTAGDGDTDKTWSADKLHDEFNGKANKYNTVLTSTLSRGRREGSTVGKCSYAFGNSVVASGENSHAEGLMSTASGENSHAEGHGTLASNARAHAEGYTTQANGANAHAEGYNTKANGPHSHAEGSNTTASHKSQHVFGEFNIADDSSASATNRGNYVEIVGNGTGPNTKSNARTLDWDGNEELAGDLTIKKGTANEVKVSELYKKPATGIPASDLENGVIPNPEDLIDDNAGEGDTDKVWSADKSHSLLTAINSKADKVGDYVDLNAGNLVTLKGVTDNAPYVFRVSGGRSVNSKIEVDKIVGGSIAWNQLVNENTETVTVLNGHKYYANISGTESIAISNGTAINVTGGTDQVMDLTQMFGYAIADYIYTLETYNAGAGVAWFRSIFPKEHYNYDAGSLQSVQVSAHKMVGFNAYNPDTGKAKVIKGNEYEITGSYTALSIGGETVTPIGGKFTPTESGDLTVTGGNSTTCIHLRWDGSRDGEYEPYTASIYELDSSLVLRGLPKLDENGNLYYDGDTYKSDGNVVRKYGVVNLGIMSWNYYAGGTNARFLSGGVSTVIAKSKGYDTISNLLCHRFTTDSDRNVSNNTNRDKTICVGSDGYIYIHDTSYSDADTFKAAMSGVYLVYELANATTESADTFTNPQTVDDFGTEEYVGAVNRDVDIPVGHDTFYRANLRGKLETAPNNPENNGDYLVRHNNGHNSYIPYNAFHGPLKVSADTDGVLKILSKYGSDKEHIITMRNILQHQTLFEISSLGIADITNHILNNDEGTNYLVSETDWVSPHVVGAVNNADGDNVDPTFTGGSHLYNSKNTATQTNLIFKVDGEIAQPPFDFECSYFDVYRIANVQGYNTLKNDGSGRNVVNEVVHWTFDGEIVMVERTVKALEPVLYKSLYGLQCPSIPSTCFNDVYYIGSKANRGINSTAEDSNSGDKYTSIIKAFDPSHTVEIGVCKDGLGDFSDCDLQHNAFCVNYSQSNTKIYQALLYSNNGLQLDTGEIIYHKCWYKFYPTV